MTEAGLIFEALDEGTKTQHRLMLGEKLVSQLWIGDLTMRIGISSVRMGGIGSVGTDRAYRNKGYARILLEKSNEWMAENGYDCATLFGIPNFYGKFGYAVCLPNCRYEVKTRSAERAMRTLTERPYTEADRAALEAIYAENNADLTGSLVRNKTTPWFSNGYWGNTQRLGSVFTNDTDEVVAYSARYKDEDRMIVCEVGTTRPEYYHDIIRSAADYAVEKRVETVTFLVSPESPFGDALSLYGASQTLSFPYECDGMARILELESFFKKTLPEWTRRAKTASDLNQGTSLRLETDSGSITLGWDGEQVGLSGTGGETAGTLRISQAILTQLAMGYHSFPTIQIMPEVKAEGDVRLAHILFPRRLGHMWQTDHF